MADPFVGKTPKVTETTAPEAGDKPVAAAMAPVPVTIIGTMADTIPSSGTIAVTPGAQQPNLVVRAITPLVAILIRFVNVYLGMVVGLLGTAATSNAITAPDFGHLLLKCAGLAVGGSVVLLLKDVVTVLGNLERKYPLATGSI
jgi:hypothetical protein